MPSDLGRGERDSESCSHESPAPSLFYLPSYHTDLELVAPECQALLLLTTRVEVMTPGRDLKLKMRTACRAAGLPPRGPVARTLRTWVRVVSAREFWSHGGSTASGWVLEHGPGGGRRLARRTQPCGRPGTRTWGQPPGFPDVGWRQGWQASSSLCRNLMQRGVESSQYFFRCGSGGAVSGGEAQEGLG